MNKTKFVFLGKTDYLDCLKIQEDIHNKKKKGLLKEDFIFITEHYPIYTLGKTTKEEHLPKKDLANIIKINRGGSITFHGENQIVVYPILDLQKRKLSVKKYIHLLEKIIIQTLEEIGIKAHRKDNLIGVFTDKGKIASIGVGVSRFITIHGFSINYDIDKKYFENIIPCGLKDIPMANITDFFYISKGKVINILYKKLIQNF
jgi:lipoyl(octanoyl) transferase